MISAEFSFFSSCSISVSWGWTLHITLLSVLHLVDVIPTTMTFICRRTNASKTGWVQLLGDNAVMLMSNFILLKRRTSRLHQSPLTSAYIHRKANSGQTDLKKEKKTAKGPYKCGMVLFPGSLWGKCYWQQEQSAFINENKHPNVTLK